ncbi:MAG: inositol monophosphatase [Alphaproteobacteria bacterium]|nr:inositol monophosphatase [Alphaproteobacteria bacterium]
MPRSPLMEVMTRAVIKASRGLRRDYGEVTHLQVSKKGTADFVSNADVNAERVLQKELQHARPKFGFLMEEGGEIAGEDDRHRWIIDPIDGTSNFIHAVPYFCISVALERTSSIGEREIIAAVIYDPLRDELFTAEKASGAFLNDRRIKVSGRRDVEDALLSTALPRSFRDNYKPALSMMTGMTGSSAGIRCFGAAALDLAYVATGRFDGFWSNSLKPWDIAAGMLLVKEAGGEVTEIAGGKKMLDSGSIVATNGVLHKKVDALLSEFA